MGFLALWSRGSPAPPPIKCFKLTTDNFTHMFGDCLLGIRVVQQCRYIFALEPRGLPPTMAHTMALLSNLSSTLLTRLYTSTRGISLSRVILTESLPGRGGGLPVRPQTCVVNPSSGHTPLPVVDCRYLKST